MEEVQLKAKLPDKCCTPFTCNKQTNNKQTTDKQTIKQIKANTSSRTKLPKIMINQKFPKIKNANYKNICTN